MKSSDKLANWAKGKVWGYYIDPLTKKSTEPFAINNIITYTAADIMARLVGGDTSYFPKYFGFIYGTTATPGLVDPIVSRNQPWTDLASELAVVNKANVLISPLASTPGYAVDAATGMPSDIYLGNAVVLSAHTGSRLEYGFTGGSYADPLEDGDYMYHAMLITRLVSGGTVTYLPFARVSLKVGSNYPEKPAGMEMALFWQISFA